MISKINEHTDFLPRDLRLCIGKEKLRFNNKIIDTIGPDVINNEVLKLLISEIYDDGLNMGFYIKDKFNELKGEGFQEMRKNG